MNTKHSSADVSNALRVKRACLICEKDAHQLKKSGVRVLTITPQLYTHDGEQRIVRMARGVSICEDCFAVTAASHAGPNVRLVAESLFERVRDSYNGILEDYTK